ncbi:hypothetical protein pb186bvf_009935 [Paramecium bursaria]
MIFCNIQNKIKIIQYLMQRIELKSMKEGYYFQCGICNQFPEIAVECKYCNKLYCFTCSQSIHSYEKRGCVCRLKDLEMMESFQQYVYSRLTIKCQICKEVIKLNVNYKQLLKDKLFENFNLIQKNNTQMPCQAIHNDILDPSSYNYQNQFNCQKFQLFQYQLKEFQSEDEITQLQSILFSCELCQQEGSIYLMRQHHLICKQQLVSCICGLKEKRELITVHILKCLEYELNYHQNQKQQIQLSINLQQIAFNQQLIENGHVSHQDFETWDYI